MSEYFVPPLCMVDAYGPSPWILEKIAPQVENAKLCIDNLVHGTVGTRTDAAKALPMLIDEIFAATPGHVGTGSYSRAAVLAEYRLFSPRVTSLGSKTKIDREDTDIPSASERSTLKRLLDICSNLNSIAHEVWHGF